MTKTYVLPVWFTCLAAALAWSAPLVDSADAADSRRPNIIFIMADDLGYGELGCYGQKKIRTPHIDKLAAEGMRFTQCYAGSNVCAPSRSVLMTGLHTGHTPVRANGLGKYLHDGDVTTAEVLKRAGYATGGFGKWGLGDIDTPGRPTAQGFDRFFGQLQQVHAHFYYPYWVWSDDTKFFLPENEGRKRSRYVHDEIHAQALQFIRDNRDRPFFCYLPYIIPHVELVAPEDSLAPYRGKFPEEPLPDPRKGYIGADEPYATFAGMVSRLDGHVGQIMALLAELDIDDNTIVFFTSDNGGQGGAWTRMTDFFDGNKPLRGYKGEFYEGGIRVPLIARWPGKVAAGSQTDHLCTFWDVMPTLSDLAGAETPANIDGVSFAPTLLGEGKQREHEYLYWEYRYGNRMTHAVRIGEWKAVQPRSGALELYNLHSDIGETTDLAAERPEVVERAKQVIAQAHAEEREYPYNGPRLTVDDYVR